VADVYKYRVTIDVEIATHETPKAVRESITEFAEDALLRAQKEPRGAATWPIDQLMRFHVRTKRLDDFAPIGPELTLRLEAGSRCPECGEAIGALVVHQIPFTCPKCRRIVRLEADGTVAP